MAMKQGKARLIIGSSSIFSPISTKNKTGEGDPELHPILLRINAKTAAAVYQGRIVFGQETQLPS